MSAIVAIGEPTRLLGLGLAGVSVLPAADAAAVRRAWDQLPTDTGLVILSPAARAALERQLGEREELLWTVLPD